MARENEHLAHLVETAVAALRSHVALGIALALKTINTVEGPTAHDRAEAEAAKATWKAADQALTDCQAGRLAIAQAA